MGGANAYSVSDQQLGQLYELMQAIQKRDQDGDDEESS